MRCGTRDFPVEGHSDALLKYLASISGPESQENTPSYTPEDIAARVRFMRKCLGLPMNSAKAWHTGLMLRQERTIRQTKKTR